MVFMVFVTTSEVRRVAIHRRVDHFGSTWYVVPSSLPSERRDEDEETSCLSSAYIRDCDAMVSFVLVCVFVPL